MVLIAQFITVLCYPLRSPLSALTWVVIGLQVFFYWASKYPEPPSKSGVGAFVVSWTDSLGDLGV